VDGSSSQRRRRERRPRRTARAIGLVTQETQLFAGTIRDNLLFVKPQATDAQCIEVLRQAAALPIIERGDMGLNKGLDTKIGEGGIKISGGERQRLAIARALRVIQPRSRRSNVQLDSITERAITETIRGLDQTPAQTVSSRTDYRRSRAQRIHVLAKERSWRPARTRRRSRRMVCTRRCGEQSARREEAA
jgi:ATP-binding cassette subfamily B protein